MHIEFHPNCNYDNLTIYNGAYRDSPLVRTWCSANPVDPVFKSSSRYLLIQFLTDKSIRQRGFRLEYDMTIGDSGNHLISKISSISLTSRYVILLGVQNYGTYGVIRSPSSPKYLKNTNWQTEVAVPRGFHVLLKFNKFELEQSKNCSKDFVQVAWDFTLHFHMNF